MRGLTDNVAAEMTTVTEPLTVLSSSDVAVIVTLPVPIAVTYPSESTVAIEVLPELQVTALLVALEGVTFAYNWTPMPW